MSLILVYIFIAFTVTAIVFAIRPLFGSRRDRVRIEYIEEELRMIEGLAAERASLLQQLRDLEFDRETNKVSDEDYQTYKRRFELLAIGVMKRLDAIRGGQNWDDIVDAELARHRGEPLPESAPQSASQTQAEQAGDWDAAAESETTPVAQDVPEEDEPSVADEEAEDRDEAVFSGGEIRCGSCGTELSSDDRFCRKCGAQTPSLHEAAEASA